jgi:hypothetical protein
MALTFTQITSTTLTSATNTVTFSSIPSTYDDLVIRTSTRGDGLGVNFRTDFRYNSNSSSVYSRFYMQSDYATASILQVANASLTLWENPESTNGSSATANQFSNNEWYIGNYASTSQNKQGRADIVLENNAVSTGAYRVMGAGLFRDNTAISSITITINSGNFVIGSSFYLYGIKRN